MKLVVRKESIMRPLNFGLTLLVATLGVVPTRNAFAQVGTAASPQTAVKRIDFKVVVWYLRDRPLATFKYQIYDVRRDEYTPAVDAWLELMRTRFPAYQVTVRDVELSREEGKTEALKVGSVIKRELMAAAALEGIVLDGELPVSGIQPGFPPADQRTGRTAGRGPLLPRSSDLGPPQPSFPVPMPFPRPHP
jgi:hypothetical protein